jgi:hypothetical protein
MPTPMRTRFVIAVVGILATAALVATPTAGAATNVRTATLKGSASFPNVTGSAKFSVDNGIRELEAQIEHAKRLAGKPVKFIVNGQLVGRATVNSLGVARIRKTGSVIPAVTMGSTIRVRRPVSNVLVASGRFN